MLAKSSGQGGAYHGIFPFSQCRALTSEAPPGPLSTKGLSGQDQELLILSEDTLAAALLTMPWIWFLTWILRL